MEKSFSWDDRGYLVSENEFYQGNEVRPSNETTFRPTDNLLNIC